MQVILIKDVDNLGNAGEVVNVRNGYGRNFLIPQGYAVEASESNLKQQKEKDKQKQKKEAKMLADINDVISKITANPIKIGAKVGSNGRIFGSVTPVQLSRAIKEQTGYEIDRRKINIPDNIKLPGEYKATIDFKNGNSPEITFEVIGE